MESYNQTLIQPTGTYAVLTGEYKSVFLIMNETLVEHNGA